MRTFEAPAMGACPLAEDTSEHRAILGEEQHGAVFFNSSSDLVLKAKELLQDDQLRARLRSAAYARIVNQGNTYRNRLQNMIGFASRVGTA